MRILWAVCAGIAVGACGCSITPKGQELITPSELTRAVKEQNKRRGPESTSASFIHKSNFQRLEDQVSGRTKGAQARYEAGPLPVALARTTAMQKLVDGIREATSGNAPDRVILKLTKKDYFAFADAAIKTASDLMVTPVDSGAKTGLVGDASFGRLLRTYLCAYADGKFIDHAGGKLGKPQLSDKGVNNDTIVGITTVVMEALFDYILEVPVFTRTSGPQTNYVAKYIPVAGQNYFHQVFEPTTVTQTEFLTKDGASPTLLTVIPNRKQGIVGDDQTGITAKEVKVIQLLSNLSGEQSKALSGMLIRSLGNVEVGFVIGADFAIGDNETFARFVETVLEVTSRRVSEAVAYEYFTTYPPKEKRGVGKTESKVAAAMEELLQTTEGW